MYVGTQVEIHWTKAGLPLPDEFGGRLQNDGSSWSCVSYNSLDRKSSSGHITATI